MAISVVNFSVVIFSSHFLVVSTFSNKNRSLENLEGRVVDGQYAKIRNYPHAVFLEITKSDKSTHICGSSIVNQNFLLTAAHCFSYIGKGKKDKILAFAGHENLYQTDIVRKTRSPIVHEDFDHEITCNDIALVYIATDLPLGNHIKRVIIKKTFPRRSTGSLAGWGVINDVTYEETMVLKSVIQTLKNKEECSQVISGPGMLCAGSLRHSDPRPAQGDSGSGLITKNYQLIGLLSFKQSSHPALPVYTNISYYYNWIKYHIKLRYCSL